MCRFYHAWVQLYILTISVIQIKFIIFIFHKYHNFFQERVIRNTYPTNCFATRNWSTPDRRQSYTFLTIDECGSKIARNNVFDCHLSQVGRQMAIENSVSNEF